MAFKLAEAYVELSQRGFSGVTGTIDRVTRRFGSMGGMLTGVTGLVPKLGLALGGLGAGVGIAGMVKMAAAAEQTEVAFSTLLGSAEQAKSVIAELTNFAATTPLQQDEIYASARSLLAFGTSTDELLPSLRAIGDIASGIQQPIGDIAEIYGKARTQGRLFMEDINQLTGRGIPIIQELAKQFGVSESAVKDLVSSGKVNFSNLEAAFQSMTGEGGRFQGMMEAQSRTLGGIWSTLSDNVGITMRQIGQGIVEGFDLKSAASSAVEFTSQFQAAIQPIMSDVIPSVQRLMSALGDSFGFVFAQMTGATGTGVDFVIEGLRSIADWAVSLMDTVAFVVDNWGLLWAVAFENISLTFSNILEVVTTWGTNAVEIGQWFFDNWKDIFVTLGDFTMTVFKNLAQNIQASLQPVHTSIAEMMLRASAAVTGTSAEELQQQIDILHEDAARKRVPFTGLLDGFKSSISEMPKLTEANVKETTDELTALQEILGQNALEAGFGVKKEPKSFTQAAAEVLGKNPALKKGAAATGESGGGSGKFTGLAELSRGIQASVLKKSDQYAQQTADATMKLASAVKGGKLQTNSGPATAGA